MISRRGFLKAAAGTIAIVAAMPQLAEADVRKYWFLDQTHLSPRVGSGIWDLWITPYEGGPFLVAEWVERDKGRGLDQTVPVPPQVYNLVIQGQLTPRYEPTEPHNLIPTSRLTAYEPEAIENSFHKQLQHAKGEGATLGQIRYGYHDGRTGDLVYRPFMEAERTKERGLWRG